MNISDFQNMFFYSNVKVRNKIFVVLFFIVVLLFIVVFNNKQANIQLDNGSNIEYCYKVGDEEINNIIITKVTGPMKNLSDDEIKFEIEKKIKKDVNKILKKIEDYESINNGENFNTNLTKIDNQNIIDESTEKDKPKTLTKKN